MKELRKYTINMRALQLVLCALERERVDTIGIRRMIRGASLDVDDPEERASALVWGMLWWMAEEESGDEAIAFRVARHIDLNDYELPAFLAQHQPTLRDAMHGTARIARSLSDFVIVSFMDRDDGVFAYLDQPAFMPVLPVLADYAVIHALKSARWLLGEQVCPGVVELARPRPRRTEPWLHFFGCPVEFNAAKTGLVMPTNLLDRALPGADPRLRAILERQARAELPPPQERDIVERTESCIAANLDSKGVPSLEEVAKRMALSTRTLRRRLAERDTSFSQLTDRTRHRLAERALQSSEASLDEIAAQLGFATTGAFSRAFKRWSGEPPGAFRARQQADDPSDPDHRAAGA